MKLKKLQEFDLVVGGTLGFLWILLIIQIVIGDRTHPRVTNFSWQNQQVGVKDRHFSLTFNRMMDQESVRTSLDLEPELPGKISWSGRTMTYTLEDLPIYGEVYTVKLQGGKTLYTKPETKNPPSLKPFVNSFSTRDRAFAYIGTEGEEKGRLILSNITRKEKNILTPLDLTVTNFKIYPNGDKILFSAFDNKSTGNQLAQQQLYTVTTGLDFKYLDQTLPIGRLQLILDDKDYQNLKFDISEDGSTIVVQRVNRQNSLENSLWIITADGKPRSLGLQGEEFKISPDGKTLAVVEARGISLNPLTSDAKPLEFYPGYSKFFGFIRDGALKLMVKVNEDGSESLFVVADLNTNKELFKSDSFLLDCQLEPRREETLFCIKSDPVEQPNQSSQEIYLAAIDLATKDAIPLLALPNYQEVKMSMSADGIGILFDQVLVENGSSRQDVINQKGDAIAAARLWLFPVPDLKQENPKPLPPEELAIGFQPQWFP